MKKFWEIITNPLIYTILSLLGFAYALFVKEDMLNTIAFGFLTVMNHLNYIDHNINDLKKGSSNQD